MRPWIKRAIGAASVLVVGAAVLQVGGLLPSLSLGNETIDRSQPVVLHAIRDMRQLTVAAGDFQVVLDIEVDVQWVPAFLAGERSLFVAAGTVDANIDFGALVSGGLVVSPDRSSVSVRVPEPTLAKPNIDNRRSYLFSQSRGIIDRLASLGVDEGQQRFYVAAEERIAAAAKESGLVERARESARGTIAALLRGMGFSTVTVEVGED